MIIKYKLSDLAKDLGQQNKTLIDLFTQWTGEVKKHTSVLTEEELNRVFEHFTKQTEEPSLDEYLASAPAPKKEAPAKPAQGKAQPQGQNKPGQPARKPEQKQPPQKRKERLRMPKEDKAAKPVEKKEVVTLTVDTSSADVNLDK